VALCTAVTDTTLRTLNYYIYVSPSHKYYRAIVHAPGAMASGPWNASAVPGSVAAEPWPERQQPVLVGVLGLGGLHTAPTPPQLSQRRAVPPLRAPATRAAP
jgi:hypothetical protein